MAQLELDSLPQPAHAVLGEGGGEKQDEREAGGVCFHHMIHRGKKLNRGGGNMQGGEETWVEQQYSVIAQLHRQLVSMGNLDHGFIVEMLVVGRFDFFQNFLLWV